MGGDEKKKVKKDPRDNLRTSAQQKAYAQLIAVDDLLSRKKKMLYLIKTGTILLGMFKKDDYNNNTIKIGKCLQEVDIEGIDPSKTKTFNKLSLPFEVQNKQEYCQKDKKDKNYSITDFLNQPKSKDILRFPLRASEEYGWHEPIDIFQSTGNGRNNLEGAAIPQKKIKPKP